MWTQLSVLLVGWLRFLKDDAAEYKTPHENNMAATECWTTALFCSLWGPAGCDVCVSVTLLHSLDSGVSPVSLMLIPAHLLRLLNKTFDSEVKTEEKIIVEGNIPNRLWKAGYLWTEPLDTSDNQPKSDHMAAANADLKMWGVWRGWAAWAVKFYSCHHHLTQGNREGWLGAPGGRPAPWRDEMLRHWQS